MISAYWAKLVLLSLPEDVEIFTSHFDYLTLESPYRHTHHHILLVRRCEAMSDIDQVPLQFINIMNLVDQLLHESRSQFEIWNSKFEITVMTSTNFASLKPADTILNRLWPLAQAYQIIVLDY